MFETIYDFLTTVPVASPVLRAFIMLAEIFALGVILYWLWERVPSTVNHIGRMLGSLRTRVSGVEAPDNAQLADLESQI